MKTEKLLSALFLTAVFLAPHASLLAQAFPDSNPTESQETLSTEGRFTPLPVVPGYESSPPTLQPSLSTRFVPIPPLEELPPAPAGLLELASAMVVKLTGDQDKVVGSDFPKKMTKTGGLEVLSKPLDPFDIVRRTDAKKSKPEKEAFIEKSWQNFTSFQSPQSQPDPRYLKHWPGNPALWASPAFCYKTLYFEQPNLERSGIGYPCPTNAVVSAGKFFSDITLLPLHALRNPPQSCQCTLGHRRPGDCNPIQR